MSGISSLAPSKHSSSSHSLASVSFILIMSHVLAFPHNSFESYFPISTFMCVCLAQMRVPSSPNQSANTSTPWEAEPVLEESGAVEDANAENLYLMGRYLHYSVFYKNVIQYIRCLVWL